MDAEWHGAGIPILAKVGAAIPIRKDVQVLSPGEKDNIANLPLDDYRAVEIFPPKGDSKGKWLETTWCEDDGVSNAQKTRISNYKIRYSTSSTSIQIKLTRDESSRFIAPWKSLCVILPVGDIRSVETDGGSVIQLASDDRGRKYFELK